MPGLRAVLGGGPFGDVEAKMAEVVLAVGGGAMEARGVAGGRKADHWGWSVGGWEVSVSRRDVGVVGGRLVEVGEDI